MQIRTGFAAALLAATICGAGLAEEPTKDCFSITTPPAVAGGQTALTTYGYATLVGSILINRCTGQTWLLARAAAGKGAVAYRWYPILSGTDEAQFSEQKLPASQ